MPQITKIPGKYYLLMLIFGSITTAFTYSAFGAGNYLELLPILTRTLDPSFLRNDFFTNASTASIARLYYANLITFLAGIEQNLPLVSLLLTLITNISIAIITFYFARDLFKKSDLAGIYAAALVMSVSTFALGWRSTIYWDQLIPATIAIPFILAATWAATRGKLLLGITICSITSLIHPLLGLEMGAVLLCSFALYHLFNKTLMSTAVWKKIIPSMLVLAIFSLISIIPQLSQPTIDTEQFIHIFAYFRTPHHRIPSTFGLARFILAGAFLSAVLLLYFRERKRRENSINLFIGILAGIIFALCLGGYLFVEIVPSRIWVTAQTFRLLYLIQWIGLILVAGVLADNQIESQTKTLFAIGILNAITLAVVALSHASKEWLEHKHNRFSNLFDPTIILLLSVAIIVYLSVPLLPVFLWGSYVLLILLFSTSTDKRIYSAVPVGVVLLIIAAIAYNGLPNMGRSDSVGRVGDNLSLEIKSELGPGGDEVAKFARENTPEESIFLTPPTWGQFRLLARRPIVVDFKAFPFSDSGMLEWYERMTDAYGMPSELGFKMIDELNANYENLNDDVIHALAEKYHITYAILPIQTTTNYEIVFQNEIYKIAHLE